MRVLVTGATGLLGRDVVRAAEGWNHELVALARTDLDVTDGAAVDEAVRSAAPGAIVNCAAFADVDGAESDPERAHQVNAIGAGNLARAAAAVGAAIVYPSTDYVFDGGADRPYVESDAPNPLSHYGRSKLAGELATAEAADRHFIVRTAALFGAGGSNFVDTMLRLAEDHGEVVVVRDQFVSPTYAADVADALVRLVSADAYGVHHIAGAGSCSWYELAGEVFAQAQVECRLLSCAAAELARPAPRPAYSALATRREPAIKLRDWRQGVGAYLSERVRA